jgi:hypothetical protein
MNSKLQIDRRTLLRGAGTAMALPLLEAMIPSALRAAPDDRPPVRMAFLYVPNGMHMPDWTPKEKGSDFELGSILQPLEQYKSEMTVLSGLTLNGARALGDGGGDHARSVAAYLTGAHPKKTDGSDIHNGVSVDQVAAGQIGMQTKLPSLELGLERSAPAGRCDSGYSCVYTSNMSWRSATSPVAKEVDPAAVFDRLFGDVAKNDSLASRSKRDRYKISVLDFVLEDANRLRGKLGHADQQKLDEYLFAVRDIERRVENSRKLRNVEAGVPDFPRPAGVPREFAEHTRLMFDLMALALQTNSTRVLTFMYTNAGSNRSYKQIGVSEGHHSLSHHGKDPKKQEKISKINHYHATLLAYFIEKLSSTPEAGGTLLDNCMVMYGSGIGDGNRHNHDDLPIVLLGKGSGSIKTGRHLEFPRNTPLTNLYVSLLERMGVHVDSFGDSTGRLENLSG